MVLEIFSHCVAVHRHRFKLRILRDSVPLRTLLTALWPKFDKFLSLFAVKFLKACIAMKDPYVDKHLVKSKVLRPVVWMLKEDYLSPLSSSCRLGGSLLTCAILDCLSCLSPSGLSPSVSGLPVHLHSQGSSLIEFLFDDPLTSRWIMQIEEAASKSRKNACVVLRVGGSVEKKRPLHCQCGGVG
ncbi:hypothetical protein cyc_03413 [Cyclospora cayetanensis]|uniref:Serine/threonine-protein phosphatase 4 regulatory subunit 3-like central domain-containing protein n=1 Tax=Cyclospora cayetanensis TaxID=88456 RepID=A0A1D3CWD3_9EIME|nr:hypothetical protein cyc_03413 [Cyclospora cayetanensis]